MINNIVFLIVLGVQQGDSVIHIHLSTLFQILSHLSYYRILSSVSYVVQEAPVWLSILNIAVHACQPQTYSVLFNKTYFQGKLGNQSLTCWGFIRV